MKRTDDTAAIERFLQHHRLPYTFVPRGKHNAVVVAMGGRNVTVFFSASGSDWRGPRNTVATLRHALGLVGKGAA
jgi:hypothetical protein